MESTTPTSAPPRSSLRQRSTSRTRNGQPLSRPTTPLRAPSRTSLRASTTTPTHSLTGHNPGFASSSTNDHPHHQPLDVLEPAFAEFSDSMADLEANMMHLQLLQESLSRFNENFGAFLYGMNMNAFTVDFTEAPGAESYRRARDMAEKQAQQQGMFGSSVGAGTGGGAGLGGGLGRGDVDATFLTTDTSFVENPPTPRTTTSSRTKMAPPPSASTASSRTTGIARGGSGIARSTSSAGGRGRGAPVVRGTRASQLAASRRETIAARGRGSGSGIR